MSEPKEVRIPLHEIQGKVCATALLVLKNAMDEKMATASLELNNAEGPNVILTISADFKKEPSEAADSKSA